MIPQSEGHDLRRAENSREFGVELRHSVKELSGALDENGPGWKM